jgi:hypothetical protein
LPDDWRYWSGDLDRPYADFVFRMYGSRLGSAATQNGNSHTPQMSSEAKATRRARAWSAYHLRVIEGRSFDQIAAELDIPKATISTWLAGVPRRRAASSERISS